MEKILAAISAFGFVVSSICALREKEPGWVGKVIVIIMTVLPGIFAAYIIYYFADITAWESLTK